MLLAAVGSAPAATIYRWVDEQGVTHYSDQPHEGAQKLRLQGAQTFAADTAPTPRAASAPEEGSAPPNGPVCAIDSPQNEQMFMNAWSVSGHVTVSPSPAGAARISLLLDGKPAADAADSGGHFTLSQVDRGTHTLTALVQDAAGQTICQSQTVTFHVHQPSVQAPNPVSRPRF